MCAISHSTAQWILKKSRKKQIPTPGIEPGPRRWERRILTTRPRGKCSVLGRVLITAQSYGLAFIGHWPAWKFASSVRVNSMRLIIYFWSDFSVICQQKAVFPPSTSFRKYRMVINLKKKTNENIKTNVIKCIKVYLMYGEKDWGINMKRWKMMGHTALLGALANVVYGPITLKWIVNNPSHLF